MKTFEKLFLEIDKMAGLRLKNVDRNVLSVRGWDELHVPEVEGKRFSAGNTLIWEGVLWTRNELESIFRPLESDGSPITYARRKGKLGAPMEKISFCKNVMVVKLFKAWLPLCKEKIRLF